MGNSTKERRFKVYQPLLLALKRAKVEKAGAVATLLLECFIEDGGSHLASKVVARGLCEEGCFHAWRDEMVKNGWLVWSINQADKGQYFVGKKLVSYINREKTSSKELVTRDEILPREEAATKAELEELRRELNAAKTKIDKVVSAFLEDNPPDTPERRKSVEKNLEDTGRLFVN